ncbi:hypothetical protein MRX96_029478 [Rhipicephalus microplus]
MKWQRRSGKLAFKANAVLPSDLGWDLLRRTRQDDFLNRLVAVGAPCSRVNGGCEKGGRSCVRWNRSCRSYSAQAWPAAESLNCLLKQGEVINEKGGGDEAYARRRCLRL